MDGLRAARPRFGRLLPHMGPSGGSPASESFVALCARRAEVWSSASTPLGSVRGRHLQNGESLAAHFEPPSLMRLHSLSLCTPTSEISRCVQLVLVVRFRLTRQPVRAVLRSSPQNRRGNARSNPSRLLRCPQAHLSFLPLELPRAMCLGIL